MAERLSSTDSFFMYLLSSILAIAQCKSSCSYTFIFVAIEWAETPCRHRPFPGTDNVLPSVSHIRSPILICVLQPRHLLQELLLRFSSNSAFLLFNFVCYDTPKGFFQPSGTLYRSFVSPADNSSPSKAYNQD